MATQPTKVGGRALRGQILALVLPVLITLSIVLILDLLGVVDSLDATLQRGHAATTEAVGVSREHSDRVVVVAGDRSTIAAWGPPPWPAARRAALLQTIEAGGAATVIELGHPPMFVDGTPSGSRIEPNATMVPGERLRDLDTGGVLWPIPAELPIRWLTPSTRLPVVPAVRVASGQIPARTFAGRVVVLGLTDPDHALPISTPVGPLSLVEIEAHALTGLGDERVPVELAPGWSYLACAIAALVLLGVRSRIGARTWGLGLVCGVAAVVVVEFALIEFGLIWLASGRLIVTVIAAAGVSAIVERIATLGAIERLHASVERELIDVDAHTPATDESGFWTELAERAATHARAIAGPSASVSLLERDSDNNALAVRASVGLDPTSHAQLATREPIERCGSAIWSASLTRRARWAQLLTAHKTVIISLPARGSITPLGVWLVHLPFDLELARADIIALEQLGLQLAAAIEWRHEREAVRECVDASQPSARLDAVASRLALLRDARPARLDRREVAR